MTNSCLQVRKDSKEPYLFFDSYNEIFLYLMFINSTERKRGWGTNCLLGGLEFTVYSDLHAFAIS